MLVGETIETEGAPSAAIDKATTQRLSLLSTVRPRSLEERRIAERMGETLCGR